MICDVYHVRQIVCDLEKESCDLRNSGGQIEGVTVLV